MEIRRAELSDAVQIGQIYNTARMYMQEHGNPNQWDQGYPSEENVLVDIDNRTSFVLEEDGVIQGVFVLVIGDEPAYRRIDGGAWHLDQTYGTIHRIASAGKMKGIAKACFGYCSEQIDYLRIDTHRDNKTMQQAILRYGFQYCGIIYVRNGERMAFDYGSY